MQIVINVPKSSPPSHASACQTTARAVVLLLDDERASPGGPWHQAVLTWENQHIRKLVRRARGAAWDKITTIPGVTVIEGDTTVRAFVPGRVDETPVEIAKLQLSGLDLPNIPTPQKTLPTPSLLVAVCPDPALPTGKAAAAAGHAAQLAFRRTPQPLVDVWRSAGFSVVVEFPDRVTWQERCATDVIAVRDAGFTVVAPGTITATARWLL